MSAMKDQLRTDLTASIKARDALRSSTLRLVLTAITTAEVAGKEAREIGDDEVMTVLGSEVKKRREAAEAFAGAGRTQMAEKESAEAAILAEYLPAQMSVEQLTEVVAAAVASTGAADEGMRAMGKVMGTVTPQTKGRADAGVVAAEVKRQLGV